MYRKNPKISKRFKEKKQFLVFFPQYNKIRKETISLTLVLQNCSNTTKSERKPYPSNSYYKTVPGRQVVEKKCNPSSFHLY